MSDARWYELCMDTDHDGPELGAFWAAVIGGRHTCSEQDPADHVEGPAAGLGIALCPVPEAKSVKHRVHLDIYARTVAELEALGAAVELPAEESGFGWTVMRDPEGGEFCAFLRDPLPDYRLHGVAVDCADPERVARWWGDRFGLTAHDNDGRGWWTLNPVTPDPVLTFDFAAVPEPKSVKNRVHWDVHGDVDSFLAAGATHLWDTPRWAVLADPEGNEFCVFP